jgi:hypothetical protein
VEAVLIRRWISDGFPGYDRGGVARGVFVID